MPLLKLTTTDGFVCRDIDDGAAGGLMRRAPKILQSGAWELARSATYSFASFSLPISGASAGVNASDNDAASAIDAAIAEITRTDPTILLDPAKGVNRSAPMFDADPRGDLAGSVYLTAHTALTAAEWAAGSLGGKPIAIEGISTSPVALAVAQEAHRRGAIIVAASSASGSVTATSDSGLDPFEMLNDDWLGSDPKPPNAIWDAPADVVFIGSKAGVLNHQAADNLAARAVVPWGPVPFTARALAVASRKSVTMVPDFLSAAGGLVGGHLETSADDAMSHLADRVLDRLTTSDKHEQGLFVGACEAAEEFISSWTELPFGRPLAA